MWIHENKNWPEFVWDIGELYPGLLEARQQLGHLLGRMDSLGFEHRQEANLRTLTGDLVRSWAIEGERLDERQVRSSVARRLGIDIGGLTSASRHVEGAVEMMLDAARKRSLFRARPCL